MSKFTNLVNIKCENMAAGMLKTLVNSFAIGLVQKMKPASFFLSLAITQSIH